MLDVVSRGQDVGEHVTISYAGFNRPWAAWIAHQLRQRSVQTTLLRWDPATSIPLNDALRDLLLAEGRVLLVLDDWYFKLGPRTELEWANALRDVVHPHLDRFRAVTVANGSMPTAVAPLRPVDLREMDEAEAARLVLQRLNIPRNTPVRATPGNAPKFPLDPPAVKSVPHRVQSFTGRDIILEDLHERFIVSGPIGARVALHGVSGVGKSASAIEYAHRFANHYDVVHWIDARTRASAREGVAALAPRLDLDPGREIGARIRAVQEALRLGKPYHRWLLIFDGADKLDEVAGLFPDGPGHVLITTLNRLDVASQGLVDINIPPFLRAESVAYARRRAPRLTAGEANLLADAVEDLPLMLAQTASWLNTNNMPVAEYVAQIRKGELARLGFRVDEDYPRRFEIAWAIALNSLREQYPPAAELLKLLAQFAPDRIPVQLIQQSRPGDMPQPLAALAQNPVAWHSALARIADATAIRLDYQTETGTEADVARARMHRLYHTFLRNELPDDESRAMSATACQLLAGADPRRPDDVREWPIYADLIPQLVPAGALKSSDPAVIGLVLNCIGYLKMRGEFTTGRELCEQAQESWEKILPPTHYALVYLAHDYANLQRRSGLYREAETTGRAILEKLAHRPADDPELMFVRSGYGGTLTALAKFEEARVIHEDLWKTYRTQLGEHDPTTQQTRKNLAVTLGLLGRYSEALTMHGEVLASRERVLGREHIRTILSSLNYAWMLRLLGRYPEAMSRQELNTRLHRQLLGENSPETLRAEHNLAHCLRRGGEIREGSQIMHGVVERSRRLQGPDHPETLMVMADWATFLRQAGALGGDLTEAAELARDVNEKYRKLVGDAHPYAAGTLSNLGLVHWVLGERDEALRTCQSAWQTMVAAVGPKHPWSLGCALNAASAMHFAGDHEGAAELSGTTAATAEEVLGSDNPLTYSCQAAYAAELRGTRRADEADALESGLIERITASLGPDHVHTVAVRRRDRMYWDFEPQPI